MLINDHLSIDNRIMTIEQSVNKVSEMRNSLYQIFSYEEFKNYRSELGQYLFDVESEIHTILELLKEIQETNRKFYDSYAQLENDYSEAKKKATIGFNNTNNLKQKLIDAGKQIEYLSNMNTNQEEYINELIEKLSCKEKEIYGCQLTRRSEYFNSRNSSRAPSMNNGFNYDYNGSIQNKFGRSEPENEKRIKEKEEKEENMKKEIPNPTKEQINVIYSKNQKKKEIINNNINNAEEKEEKIIPQQIQPITINENEDTTERKKARIDRIQEIVLKAFNDEPTLSYLKSKYGSNFEDKIISEEVKDEFLSEVENEIKNFSQGNVNSKSSIEQNIPEKESEVITGHFNQKVTNENTDFKVNHTNKKQEPEKYSTLKNYFILNLKRDLMMSKGK